MAANSHTIHTGTVIGCDSLNQKYVELHVLLDDGTSVHVRLPKRQTEIWRTHFDPSVLQVQRMLRETRPRVTFRARLTPIMRYSYRARSMIEISAKLAKSVRGIDCTVRGVKL